MDSQIAYKCAGDSGYTISQMMVKQYPNSQILNDP